MPKPLVNTQGGKSISFGSIAVNNLRIGTGQVNTNWFGLVPPDVPVLGAASGATGGFSFTITNYDPAVIYTVSTNSGSVSAIANTVTVTGLADAASATVTVTANSNGLLAQANQSGTSFTRLAAPTTGTVTSTVGGFTFLITNFNALNTYNVSVPAGSVSRATDLVTVTGLANGASTTVTVAVSRTGFAPNQSTPSGSAQAKLATPTISAASQLTGGWNATITNFDALNTYTVTVTPGTISRATAVITAAGLANGASSTATVTASRSGFVASDSAQRTGTATPNCTSCAFAGTSVEGGNCGTCNIFGNTHIVCYNITFYTGSPSGCIGCNAAVGGWYNCVGTCCAVCGSFC
jgi:hypothetical protein